MATQGSAGVMMVASRPGGLGAVWHAKLKGNVYFWVRR